MDNYNLAKIILTDLLVTIYDEQNYIAVKSDVDREIMAMMQRLQDKYNGNV